MSKAQVTFDSSQFDAMVNHLTGTQMKKAMISTLRSSANILKKETEAQFHSRVDLNGYKITYQKKGREKTKVKRLVTVVINKKDSSAKVHIMGDFRAKFFEKGTKERYTKGHKITDEYWVGKRKYLRRSGKGGRRGRISAGYYFRTAQQLTERKIFSDIDKRLSKAIITISKRK